MEVNFFRFVLVATCAMLAVNCSPLVTEDEGGICGDTWLFHSYSDCWFDAPTTDTPVVLDNDYPVIPARFFVERIRQYCLVTFPATQQCFGNKIEGQRCPNATRLIQRAQATGGACDGLQPADWLQEGLLDRVGDLYLRCLNNFSSLLGECVPPQASDPEGDGYMDDQIDCMVRAVQVSSGPACNKPALLSLLVMHPGLQARYGKAPSSHTLQALKNIRF